MSFDTEEQHVTFAWSFMAEGATRERTIEHHQVSFKPTALNRMQGAGPRLLVAGYSERSDLFILERWTVDDLAVGAAGPQGAEGTPKSLLAKSVRKQRLLETPDIGPVHSVVYNPSDGMIWLFEEAAPHLVFRFDPATPGAVPQPHLGWDSQALPFLATTRSVSATQVGDEAPDGGGFVMLFSPRRAWENAAFEDLDISIARDVDRDGTWDEIVDGTWRSLIVDRGYLGAEQLYSPFED